MLRSIFFRLSGSACTNTHDNENLDIFVRIPGEEGGWKVNSQEMKFLPIAKREAEMIFLTVQYDI